MAMKFAYDGGDIRLIQALRDAGHTWDQVGKAMGRSTNSLKAVVRRRLVRQGFQYKKAKEQEA